MKTIKERANLAAWQIFEEIGLSKHSVDRVAEIIEEKIREQKSIDDERITKLKSFVERATKLIGAEKAFREHLEAKEKKLIDNACKWLEKNSPDIEYITNASVYRQSKSEFIDTFRKAMEEDL